METTEKGYVFSDSKDRLDPACIERFLGESYWANGRDRAAIAKSIENSLCYGIYREGAQVGFARVVTDDATMYWLCDVYIDSGHRGHGLGRRLVELITSSDRLRKLNGSLATKDAHSLYEEYGFERSGPMFMRRPGTKG
ncbi:GNAT family N-acetyltransferase [Paenibacillus humicus]|uniref:GNAT family N-acetyltransferase n=1 Tax=Paenibacillus humicus TaxID=412861 RepID=UPI000FD8ED83|nr:GNAT family N-acetyltransferase [Paenibacillus humicus]